jgi:hypothetical protein
MFAALISTVAAAAASKNGMNGYTGGNMNGKYSVWSGSPEANWNDDYASKGYEYFDIWAPEMATHYGEVFWTDQGNVPLPPALVERFKGKTMAIQGYEQDQVMVTPVGKPGVNPEQDVSVPINWAYNHHYMAWMTGTHSELRKVDAAEGTDYYGNGAHGQKTVNKAFDLPSAADRADTSIPTSQMFSEGNGGESRKSFHGYPDGYAQLIDSPSSWHITPMQIDTRNRACGVTPADVHKCKQFTPGIEPRQARYGRGIPKEGTNYSGILECPCNGGYGGDPQYYKDHPESGNSTKIIEHSYAAIGVGSCDSSEHVQSATDCFDAIATIGINAKTVKNSTVSDASVPFGCSVTTVADGSAVATFNTLGDKKCAASTIKAGSVKTSIGVTVAISLDNSSSSATITMSGPSTAWFAVGLNAVVMSNSPYTLVANDTGVFEQKLGTCGSEAEHCPGDLLKPSVKLVSNSVTDGVRTVVMTRPFAGLTKNHYTFDVSKSATINFIAAVGSSQVFAYHKAHYNGEMSFVSPVNVATCICDQGKEGLLCNSGGKGCGKFVKRCVAPPAGSLLEQHNPTCNSRQYVGGLSCCHHGRIMLDEDQNPGSGALLRYHMKWRFWFQEYKPAQSGVAGSTPSHYDLPRIYYQTEANAGEYDIPPAFSLPGNPVAGYGNWPLNKTTPGTTCTGTCPNGPDCECVHTIKFHWTMSNTRIVYAGGHCHAPACKSIELWENKTGTPSLICRQLPKYGTGDITTDKYDEAGYLALPPCLFAGHGEKNKGLQPGKWIEPNTPMYSIKINRNTHMGHYGEMASWQMRGVNFPEPNSTSIVA